jgi:dTDP-4-dehydrorhamnose reductase
VADILITGGSGQVGTALQRLAPKGWTIAAPSRETLDLGDPASVAAAVEARPWSAIISAGAYTAVDKAESEVTAAWRANALGPAALAEAAAKTGAPLIHLSTDYVFDGSKPGWYVEDDPVAPIGVYGASKEGGEQAVRTACPRHVILRTAWVVSPDGGNFLKTMLRLGKDRPALRVVDDQRGCPTSAADIAKALAAVASRLIGDADAPTGTYHFVNDGEATWCEFARSIFEDAAPLGWPRPEVEAIPTSEYPTPARRPANSRLSTAKLRADFGVSPRPWRTASREIVETVVRAAG